MECFLVSSGGNPPEEEVILPTNLCSTIEIYSAATGLSLHKRFLKKHLKEAQPQPVDKRIIQRQSQDES